MKCSTNLTPNSRTSLSSIGIRVWRHGTQIQKNNFALPNNVVHFLRATPLRNSPFDIIIQTEIHIVLCFSFTPIVSFSCCPISVHPTGTTTSAYTRTLAHPNRAGATCSNHRDVKTYFPFNFLKETRK